MTASRARGLPKFTPKAATAPRKRKRFATKGEAQVWEKWLLEESNSNPWLTANKVTEDKRRLSDIIEQWYRLHGQTLVAGDQVRRKLDLMAGAMGDPYAVDFNKSHFAAYREGRLTGAIIFPGRCRDRAAGPKTVNDEQRLLNAVFGELIRLGGVGQSPPADGAAQGEDPRKRDVFSDGGRDRPAAGQLCKKPRSGPDHCGQALSGHRRPLV